LNKQGNSNVRKSRKLQLMNKDNENNNGNYDYADTDEPAAGANGH
jgi:hypothetical protein